jgi:type IV secretion system protein VirB6
MKNVVGSTGRDHVDGQGNTHRTGRSGTMGLAHYSASMAGRGVAASSRAVAQRIRPSTGGSLSDRKKP